MECHERTHYATAFGQRRSGKLAVSSDDTRTESGLELRLAACHRGRLCLVPLFSRSRHPSGLQPERRTTTTTTPSPPTVCNCNPRVPTQFGRPLARARCSSSSRGDSPAGGCESAETQTPGQHGPAGTDTSVRGDYLRRRCAGRRKVREGTPERIRSERARHQSSRPRRPTADSKGRRAARRDVCVL